VANHGGGSAARSVPHLRRRAGGTPSAFEGFGFGNAAARALEIPVVGGILAVRGQIDGDIPRRFD